MSASAVLTVALAVGCTACSRREPITSCAQSLEGAWHSDHADEQWMILERGATLEAYPLVPDAHVPGAAADLETAPRAIDLDRSGDALHGTVSRRFMQRGVACIAKADVHVISCANDVIELVLADPPVPAAFEPCTSPRPDSSRRERWSRD
jgi:hypothetical protein